MRKAMKIKKIDDEMTEVIKNLEKENRILNKKVGIEIQQKLLEKRRYSFQHEEKLEKILNELEKEVKILKKKNKKLTQFQSEVEMNNLLWRKKLSTKKNKFNSLTTMLGNTQILINFCMKTLEKNNCFSRDNLIQQTIDLLKTQNYSLNNQLSRKSQNFFEKKSQRQQLQTSLTTGLTKKSRKSTGLIWNPSSKIIKKRNLLDEETSFKRLEGELDPCYSLSVQRKNLTS